MLHTETIPAAITRLADQLRTARAARPPSPLRRMMDDARQRATFDEAQPVKRPRRRRPSVSGVIRQMKRAGVEVAGCEVTRDGTIRIISGKPATITDSDITDTTIDPTWN